MTEQAKRTGSAGEMAVRPGAKPAGPVPPLFSTSAPVVVPRSRSERRARSQRRRTRRKILFVLGMLAAVGLTYVSWWLPEQREQQQALQVALERADTAEAKLAEVEAELQRRSPPNRRPAIKHRSRTRLARASGVRSARAHKRRVKRNRLRARKKKAVRGSLRAGSRLNLATRSNRDPLAGVASAVR